MLIEKFVSGELCPEDRYWGLLFLGYALGNDLTVGLVLNSAVGKVRGQMPKHTKSPTFQHTRTAPSHLIRAFNFTDTTSCI